jgi:hypothetical protein
MAIPSNLCALGRKPAGEDKQAPDVECQALWIGGMAVVRTPVIERYRLFATGKSLTLGFRARE